MRANSGCVMLIGSPPRFVTQSRRSGPAGTRPIMRGPLGDTVEPRREFIEKNDLQVSNLDV